MSGAHLQALAFGPPRFAFMVSLSNHEGAARTAVRTTSWFDKLTMKRFLPHEPTA